jgi:predicted phosphodiesterase
MRVVLVGDIHAEDGHLEQCLAFAHKAGVERVLCTGDVVDGPGDAARCCRLLQVEKVVTVRGNHDRWFVEDSPRNLSCQTSISALPSSAKEFIASLPPTIRCSTGQGSHLLLCHGIGTNDMARLTPYDYGYGIEVNAPLQELIRLGEYRYVVGGHTHVPMVRHFRGLTFINPGTLLRGNHPGFALLDLDAMVVQRYRLTRTGVEPASLVDLDGGDWPPYSRHSGSSRSPRT